jgi:hypothetical protein
MPIDPNNPPGPFAPPISSLTRGTTAARHPLFASHLAAAVVLLAELAHGDARTLVARAHSDACVLQWEAHAWPPSRFYDREETQQRLRDISAALQKGYGEQGKPESTCGVAEAAMVALGYANKLAENLRPGP